MIRYSLQCDNGHEFEGWFASSADFDKQAASGYVSCPHCNSLKVGKLLMAPNVTTGRQKDEIKALVMDNSRREVIAKIKEAVSEIRRNAEDVGEKFPEEARKIHYGESEARGIIGQASVDEAEALIDEGIEIAALPHFPDDVN
ncbi:DUF1178 family protein [Rhizobium sp. KVB221]|uniref:DUF1178 family protein n=1 Tax=Rhizobium setariae TaxID=2801340 RepID=A0A937CPA5_9HYPH|nr:DUF1178 family protein [Rhizobium setariae]